MAEYLPPTRRRPVDEPEDFEGRPPFDFHDKKVVNYTWKIHHVKMLMCDMLNPNVYSPFHGNIPFFLEMYPRGRGGNTFDIFVYLHWRLEEEAVVNVRLVFYGSERVVLWSDTITKQKVSRGAPLLLPKGPDFLDVHEMESDYLIDDGYLWIKCTVWKYDGPPEMPSVDKSYHNIEIKTRTRMDQRLLVRPRRLSPPPTPPSRRSSVTG